ncbi:MAG: hypothetical protein WC734_04585 [Patescibacteria group bacterium]|jgi:uncharacterized membrane protein HdeD (DUF308 family)
MVTKRKTAAKKKIESREILPTREPKLYSNWELISSTNLLLGILIGVLAYWNYQVSGNVLALFIALAFIMFCASHVTQVMVAEKWRNLAVTLIRFIGYAVLLAALFIA